ncbi:MAG: NAD(P)-dependent alcohol dehydrogenase [Chthoniobacteraceae bacterium]
MKAWQIQHRGSLDGLMQVELPDPVPAPDEVLVRIRAVALNFRDLIATRIERPNNLTPLIPCSDGAGEVIAVGANVTAWKPGDRVIGCFFQAWEAGRIRREVMRSDLGGPLHGVLAEKVALRDVVAMPSHMSFEQACTLPCAALTAWHALVEEGGVSADETVLLLGTGGVSIFALQFAKLHGARVIITSSSDTKLAKARALGADETINYREFPDWQVRVHELTGRRGADHVVEVGGWGTLEKSFESVGYGGKVHLIGVLTGFEGKINPWQIIVKSLRVQGYYVGNREMFDSMNRTIEQHRFAPVIDSIYEFGCARDAFALMESRAHFGKIVIRV